MATRPTSVRMDGRNAKANGKGCPAIETSFPQARSPGAARSCIKSLWMGDLTQHSAGTRESIMPSRAWHPRLAILSQATCTHDPHDPTRARAFLPRHAARVPPMRPQHPRGTSGGARGAGGRCTGCAPAGLARLAWRTDNARGTHSSRARGLRACRGRGTAVAGAPAPIARSRSGAWPSKILTMM